MLDRGALVGADQDQVGGQGNGQIRHLVHLGWAAVRRELHSWYLMEEGVRAFLLKELLLLICLGLYQV